MAKKRFERIDADAEGLRARTEKTQAKHDSRRAVRMMQQLTEAPSSRRHEAPAESTEGEAAAAESPVRRKVGRPSTGITKVRTTLFVEESLLQELKREAYESGKTSTEIINAALRAYLSR